MRLSARIGTVVVALISLVGTGCAGDRAGTIANGQLPAVFRDRDAAASDLFTVYSDALVDKDTALLDEVVADEFIVQRADGSWTDKAGFLSRLPDLRSFRTDEFVERRGVNVVVARCIATAELSVNGAQYRTTSAPMLVVFEWADGHWVLQAQGNFNLPQA